MSDLNIYADQTAIDALTPITGDVVLRASDNAVLLYNGSAWKEFQPDAGPFSNSYSLNFDGVDDYLTLASEITLTAPFSLSFWIKPGNDHVFLTATSTGSSYIYFESNGNVKFREGSDEVTTTTYTTNIWQHFAFTVDGSNNLEVYKNGSATGPYPLSQSIDFKFKDVGRYKANTHFLNGYSDELSVFNSALSSSDVSSLIDTTGSNPVPADISSLSPIHWWRMGDNDSGTTVTDQGSGSNNLSFQSAPVFSSDVPS